ncbi:MAG: Stp1/IreP family PP2C-type Ser/Thr phosphatase, partial [Acidimicrobiales bacterium]
MTVLRGAAATDVGRVRQINEDRFLVDEELFAVADGVGGHQAGEVASATSVDALRDNFTERTTAGLVAAIQEANRAVWRLAQERSERRGMGTTLTAIALVDDGDEEELAVANVGDSRVYLFQQGDLVQVTEDHSLVEELVRGGQLTPEEAQVHPQRSIITRALGMEPEIEVDAWNLIPYAGDRLLLCSDGLTNELSVDRIAAVLRQLADPQEAASELVRQARAHGGNDNITVVVVDIADDGGRAERASLALAGEAPPPRGAGVAWTQPPPSDPDGDGTGRASTATATKARPISTAPDKRRTRERGPRKLTWRVLVFVTLLLVVLGVVAAALNWYARSQYYVGVAPDNVVTIYRGSPGGFLWIEPEEVRRTTIRLDDV